MYQSNSAMTTGRVTKYLIEQNSINSINSIVQILRAHKLIAVKKVKNTYYVFIKLYSTGENFTITKIPFVWRHKHAPSAEEGILSAKAQYKLLSMLGKS